MKPFKNQAVDQQQTTFCFHCGDACPDLEICYSDKYFCCDGCRFVYEILDKNNLCNYYELNNHPGNNLKAPKSSKQYEFLKEPEIEERIVSFRNRNYSVVTLYLPGIHCSSCLWLLQNLNRFNEGIISSNVSFEKKEVKIIYKHLEVSLQEIARLLNSVGYPPSITLEDIYNKRKPEQSRALVYKMGIAAFCFGNIMLLSFPDYLATEAVEPTLAWFFRIIAFGLSLPVLFYCSSEFYIPAWKSLMHGFINIDLPIVFALLMAFGVSVYQIFGLGEAGYLDSMAGIVFFMLIGRWLQNKTYQNIYFDKNYQSFLPVSVTQKIYNQTRYVKVSDIKPGDIIEVKYGEIIPFDGKVADGLGVIDYSFITGETATEDVEKGGRIYAGGKHLGTRMELEVSTSYDKTNIADLWQGNNSSKIYQSPSRFYIQKVSRYFALLLIFIAIAAGIWHFHEGLNITLKAFTSVLIIACPCTLLLAHTFTDGFMLNHLAGKGLYIKNALVMDEIALVKKVVFDKTGTLTESGKMELLYEGEPLNDRLRWLLYNLVRNSAHPMSVAITELMGRQKQAEISNYHEIPGSGLEGIVSGALVRVGSASFLGINELKDQDHTHVYFELDGQIVGFFLASHCYRNGLSEMFFQMNQYYDTWMMSGDKAVDKDIIQQYIPQEDHIIFRMKPQDKQHKVKELRSDSKVLMVGDGLNDLAAFNEADIALAIWNDASGFTPASDMVLQGHLLHKLHWYLKYMSLEKRIVYACFGFSLLYNVVGITYAVMASLNPLIAAVLMPLSSFTIIFMAWTLTGIYKRKFLDNI